MVQILFTPAQDAAIIELRRQRISWPKIADQLGRMPEACRSRFKRLVPKEERRKTSRLDMWTDEENATLARLVAEGKPSREIAAILNRPLHGTKSKIQYQKTGPLKRGPTTAVAPPECIAERERRLSAPRDLTAIFMGDPPKGYSALDRKMATA